MSSSAIHKFTNDVLPVGMVVLHDSTLAADSASFDVQSIPQSYKHLLLLVALRTDAAVTATTFELRFNGDSGANYGSHYVQVNNVTAGAGSNAGGTDTIMDAGLCPGANAPSGRFGGGVVFIPDYASTDKDKSIHSLTSALGAAGISSDWYTRSLGGAWDSTAAINRVTLYPSGASGNLKAGSRLTIYGLGGAPIEEVTGTDGWTRDPATWTYASSSTFTVSGDQTVKFSKGTRIKLTQTTAKYLVVTASSYSSGTTTVTVTGGTDYSLANAAITDNYYSYAANPQGYPGWFAFTPTWASSGTQPSLGNGTLEGYMNIVGTQATVTWRLVMGSTTTYGTGIYTLSHPLTAVYPSPMGTCDSYDQSTGNVYSSICRYNTTTTVAFLGSTVGAFISNTVPHTWAQSDELKGIASLRI